MRHPRIDIASISLAAAAAVGSGITATTATTSPCQQPTCCQSASRGYLATVQATVGGKTKTVVVNGQGLPRTTTCSTRRRRRRHRRAGGAGPPLTSASPTATGLTGKLAAVMDVHGDRSPTTGTCCIPR